MLKLVALRPLNVVILLTLGLLPTPSVIKAQSSQASAIPVQPTSSAAMDQAIHDYLLAHPEVMLESIRDFDVRRKAAEQQKIHAKVQESLPSLQNGSPASATADAHAVTIVEFFDYRCGFCKKVQPTVAELVKRPGVRVVYKDLPILGPDSMRAAKAALAAERQGGYAKLHDAMIASATPLTLESISALATSAGLDAARLRKDMDSAEVTAAINGNLALAGKLNIEATPTFVVGDQMVSGALTSEAFDQMIAAAKTAATGGVPVVASVAH